VPPALLAADKAVAAIGDDDHYQEDNLPDEEDLENIR
jgi:hypothetical protein